MKTLVIGAGALGGIIAARLLAAGRTVSLSTRSAGGAAALMRSGLTVSGVGGRASVPAPEVAPTEAYLARDRFDLVVLATKAQDALAIAPTAVNLLAAGGTLLPIQNGGVAQKLAELIPDGRVLGGLSNLGAAMTGPGAYEQRNAGHLLIGELGGGESARASEVQRWLGAGVEVRVTPNFPGAVWSKLLLNCSVTTLGAIAGRTLREYVQLPGGREVFAAAYCEALAVAQASGTTPARMLVDPIPPAWDGRTLARGLDEAWLDEILRGYGDIKPSMLQDLERGRPTEIDFINGYVVERGQALGVPVPVNAAIADAVRAISRGALRPAPERLTEVLAAAGRS